MLIKFKGCELEFDRVCFYADVPRFGEVYLRRSQEAREGRWFERVSERGSLQVHLGRTHIILCRPVRGTSGRELPLAP